MHTIKYNAIVQNRSTYTCRREYPQFHFSFQFGEGPREGKAERHQSNCEDVNTLWYGVPCSQYDQVNRGSLNCLKVYTLCATSIDGGDEHYHIIDVQSDWNNIYSQQVCTTLYHHGAIIYKCNCFVFCCIHSVAIRVDVSGYTVENGNKLVAFLHVHDYFSKLTFCSLALP